LAFAPAGQQLSPDREVAIGVCMQVALQLLALPLIASSLHGLVSTQSWATGQRWLAAA
jgi:hypothetical protein